MLNEYLDKNGKVFCEKCGSIIPKINKLVQAAPTTDILVIFNNTALTDSGQPMAKKWGLHAEKGSWGSQVYPALTRPADAITVEKTGYNGFFQTNLESVLKAHNVKKVAICGIHTHVCVLLTATAAFEYGYDVYVIKDAVTTGYQPNHDTRLRYFDTHIGKLITADEWLALPNQ